MKDSIKNIKNVPYTCNKQCRHYLPKGGSTNCQYYPEKLDRVIWVPLEQIKTKCYIFMVRPTLDEILGIVRR